MIDAEIEANGKSDVRHEARNYCNQPLRQPQSTGFSDSREYRVFGDELPEQAPARGAERDAHAHLAPARIIQCQNQVGNVRACNEQNSTCKCKE